MFSRGLAPVFKDAIVLNWFSGKYRIQILPFARTGNGEFCLSSKTLSHIIKSADTGEQGNFLRSQGLMKLKLFLFLIFITVPTVSASPQKKSDFIGYRHKGVLYGQTLPNGVRDMGGGLLSDSNYGVTRFSKGKKYMLWLEKITHFDSKGAPSWVVKDVLMFDNLKKNQEFLFSYSSGCTQNGTEDLDLVVLAEFSRAKKRYKVSRAWRADPKKEKFEKLSNKGIECAYEEP